MMYVTPVAQEPEYPQVTDADLERFNWFIIAEIQGGVFYRILTMEKPRC